MLSKILNKVFGKTAPKNPVYCIIDVETANPQKDVCQLGWCIVYDDDSVKSGSTFVKPASPIQKKFTAIHGITNNDVKGAPTIDKAFKWLATRIGNVPVIAHNMEFDSSAIIDSYSRAGKYFDYNVTWRDSLWVFRVKEHGAINNKLSTLASHYGYRYQAHDAEQDCLALHHVMIASGFIDDILSSSITRPDEPDKEPVMIWPFKEDALKDMIICFTGAISTPRDKCMDNVLRMGGRVTKTVTKKTTHLVTGRQQHEALVSNSQLKAIEYGIPQITEVELIEMIKG